jgi:ectoine hydroxylase-related dioxygenase (phytanoyl-CoA dioxygenase family)
VQNPAGGLYSVAMGLHHFRPDTDPDIVATFLHDHGYAIVDGVADHQLLTRLETEAAPFIERSSHGRDVYDGQHTRRTGSLVARCPASRDLVMHPIAVGVAKAFLSHVTAIQLHLTQIISIEPGETAQKLHRDQMAFDFYPFPPHYHVQCNTMWALTDFTAENGATHVVPGSSSVSEAAAASLAEFQAEMTRGSVLFYDGKVLHGGGANRSHSVRRGVNITYSVGWVRQEENQFLACPAEIARTLDDDLLRLMGYQQGAFALGYVGDQQDALAVLRGTDEKVKVIGEFAEQRSDAAVFVKDL